MRANVDGALLFFDVTGEKLVPDGPMLRERPTLVLLHGGPGADHSGFKPAFSSLADVCQVVFLDHRSMGRSETRPRSEWNLARWATDVKAFCEELEIRAPIVLGHSFGAYVAMEYAIRFPTHPGGIVLSSASAREDPNRVFDEFERLGGQQARDAATAFYTSPSTATYDRYKEVCFPLYSRTLVDPDATKRKIETQDVLFHFWFGEMQTIDLLERLARVRRPTLVMAGGRDPITPMRDAEDLVASLPPEHVTFARFEDDGHALFRDNAPRYFAELRSFIERVGGKTASSSLSASGAAPGLRSAPDTPLAS